MNIFCIIQVALGVTTCYDTSVKSLSELKSAITNDLKLAIVISNEDGSLTVADLLKILTYESATTNITTWSQLADVLTVQILNKYLTIVAIPRYITTMVNNLPVTRVNQIYTTQTGSPIYHSCDNMQGVTVGYSSFTNQAWYNFKVLRHKQQDLVFSQSSEPKLNFANTMPIVNGIVHYPQVADNKLWVINGVEAVKQTFSSNKNIILTDFSPIGNLDFIKFSACSQRTSSYHHDQIVKLPAGKSLTGKYLMVVLAGRIFFDYELVKISDRSFRLNIDRKLIGNILLTNKLLKAEYIPSTNQATLDNVDSFLSTGLWQANNNTSFIVLLDNPSLIINQIKPLFRFTPDKLKFPRYSFGWLIRSMTREIVDYTKIDYIDSSVVTFAPPCQNKILWTQNSDNLDKQTHISNTRNALQSSYTDTTESEYVIHDLIGQNL